jgi:hypothetical protein
MASHTIEIMNRAEPLESEHAGYKSDVNHFPRILACARCRSEGDVRTATVMTLSD